MFTSSFINTERVVCKQNDVRTRQTEHFKLLKKGKFTLELFPVIALEDSRKATFYSDSRERGEGRSSGKSIKAPVKEKAFQGFFVCIFSQRRRCHVNVRLNEVLFNNSQGK